MKSVAWSQGGKEYPANKRKKANWIGHILHRSCLLEHTIEGGGEGRIAVLVQ